MTAQKTKNTCGKILGNIGLFLLVFLAAVPVLWLIYLSLKSNTDILTNPLALPDTLHWENYVNAYKTIPFYSMVKNTGIVILISVPVSMLLSIFAAFALGRMRFGSGKVQNGVYFYFVCGVIMPTCVMILPIYLVMVKVGLYDTLWSTILTHIGWTAPMNMMIMVSGFRSIPDSLEEAAIIDGCSIWQLLFRILVPVAKPVISTALIMTFLACWNDFPLAKIMLNSPDVRTLSIAAAYFKGTFSTNYALMTAGCVILIIPQLLIFTRLNDYLRHIQPVHLIEVALQQGGTVVLRCGHGGAAAVDAVQLHADIRLRQSQRQHQRQGQYPTYNSLLHLSPSLRAQQSPLYPVLCSL